MVKPKVRIHPATGVAYSDADITEYLTGYRWIVCRSYGHAWNPPDGFYGAQVNGRYVYEKKIPCMRCPTQRIERIRLTRDGIEDDSRAYMYPIDYQAEPGMNLSRADFRQTKQSRELVEQQERAESVKEAPDAQTRAS